MGAAWHYPGTNGGCAVTAGGAGAIKEPGTGGFAAHFSCVGMAGGAGVTKEQGTDRFAARFNEVGFTVLAFDFRHLGESEGEPRQIARVPKQLHDYEAAFEFARTLPGVDPTKVAIWGFSLAGGHVMVVAARNPDVAAVIAQTPLADARAVASTAIHYATLRTFLRLVGRGVIDAVGSVFGREPLLVPLAAEPGTVAAVNSPDGQQGHGALDPGGSYPDWRREIAARSAIALGFYRPIRSASRVESPLLVVACD